jgi:hypothetical protein
MVNEELVKKHVELAWNFGETLSHVFSLPEVLVSTAAFGLKVDAGRVKVTDTALGFAVSFGTEVTRRVEGTPSSPHPDAVGVGDTGHSDLISEAGLRDATRPALVSVVSAGRVLRSGGALAVLALAAAFALGRASVGRHSR